MAVVVCGNQVRTPTRRHERKAHMLTMPQIDKESRVVSEGEAVLWAEEQGFRYIEASAATGSPLYFFRPCFSYFNT